MREIVRLAPDVVDLLSCVVKVCSAYSGSVTSWYRTPRHNMAVGSSRPHSKHLCACAVDIVYDNGNRPLLSILQADCAIYRVRVIREHDHDHLECIELPTRMFF